MEIISVFHYFLQRYILQDCLVATGDFGKDDRSVEEISKMSFFSAILLSVVPVSATTAEVVPVCVGVLTVPRYDLCSSLTEKPCTDGYKSRYFLFNKMLFCNGCKFQSLPYWCQNFAFSYAIYIFLCYLLHASLSL